MGSGQIGAPVARLLANMIVMSMPFLGRMGSHFMEAYKQALANGGGAAAGAAASKAAHRIRSGIAEHEARMILNLKEKGQISDSEIKEAHDKLTAMNEPAKGGSAYLQQKIANARDALLEAPPEDSKDAK